MDVSKFDRKLKLTSFEALLVVEGELLNRKIPCVVECMNIYYKSSAEKNVINAIDVSKLRKEEKLELLCQDTVIKKNTNNKGASYER